MRALAAGPEAGADVVEAMRMQAAMGMIEGSPGTGKTTISTPCRIAGAEAGKRCLCMTLAETEEELRAGAASHGWDLAGIEIFELVPPESLLDEDQQQSLLDPSDLELGETTKRVFEVFERIRPDRIVLDRPMAPGTQVG